MSSNPYQDSPLPCFDPECHDEAGQASTAEPEQDGDHYYHLCTVCGYAFGYHRITPETVAVSSDETCAVGVPAELRRAASAAMREAITHHEQPLTTIGRRPDATP